MLCEHQIGQDQQKEYKKLLNNAKLGVFLSSSQIGLLFFLSWLIRKEVRRSVVS